MKKVFLDTNVIIGKHFPTNDIPIMPPYAFLVQYNDMNIQSL